MESYFYVIATVVTDRYLNVGEREVYFNRAGHSAALTEVEYNRLLTVPGFAAADGPPHVEAAVDLASGTMPCPFCEGRGRVPAGVYFVDAMQDGHSVTFPAPEDMGDAPALPLEYGALEVEEETILAYPPPPEVPLPVTLASEEILAWQEAAVPRRIGWVEETNFDAEQLLTLFNAEAAGKNSPRVLKAIDEKRNKVVETKGAAAVNAALIAANIPKVTEE